MRQADLVVATGSQANVRAAYASGTPAFGVGAGNVAAIVDETADLASAAEKIVRSKTFDNATSCSSENSVVAGRRGLRPPRRCACKRRARRCCSTRGRGAAAADDVAATASCRRAVIGQSAAAIAERAGLARPLSRAAERPDGRGKRRRPRASVLRREAVPGAGALSRARFRRTRCRSSSGSTATRAPGTRSACTRRAASARSSSGSTLPVSRVIVNQAHCFATGGSFDNGLPFSLSMGCGTWGRNSFSDNLNYRHFLNITRVSTHDPRARAVGRRDLRRVFRAPWPRLILHMSTMRTVRQLIDARATQRPERDVFHRAAHRPVTDVRRSCAIHASL